MAATRTQPTETAAEAREDVALRLERLARMVRAGTTTDIKALDEAYAAIVKLAGQIKGILRVADAMNVTQCYRPMR
jgi:hypothetical protein